jgi:hypothetical protein
MPIDGTSNSRPDQNIQPNDALSWLKASPTDDIVRRGQEALQRLRRGYEDWLAIAEALQVGRAEVMAAVQTNKPVGKRYAQAMANWLLARGFHLINEGTRNRLLDCLNHGAEIEKWRATLTEGERFRFNHPDTVLRKWKAATVVPDPNVSKKPSPIAKLKEVNVELQEKLYRAEQELSRGGGDLWTPDDTPEDIATAMLAKLTPDKAKGVAKAILTKVKGKVADPSKNPKNLDADAIDARVLEVRRAAGKGVHLNENQWRAVDRMRKRSENLRKAERASAEAI